MEIDFLLLFLCLCVTAVGGLVGIGFGFGFRKGIPLLWRAAIVVGFGIFFAVVNLAGGFNSADLPNVEEFSVASKIAHGFLTALCFFGVWAICSAVVHVAQSIKSRIDRRKETP